MKNFLDKTFNLAGLLRGFFIGLVIGLILCFLIFIIGGVNLIKSDNIALIVFCFITFLPAIVFAVLGACSKPVEISDNTKKWVGSTQSILNIGLLSGRGIVDQIFPEKITIKKFLIWTIIYGLCFLLLLYLFSFK